MKKNSKKRKSVKRLPVVQTPSAPACMPGPTLSEYWAELQRAMAAGEPLPEAIPGEPLTFSAAPQGMSPTPSPQSSSQYGSSQYGSSQYNSSQYTSSQYSSSQYSSSQYASSRRASSQRVSSGAARSSGRGISSGRSSRSSRSSGSFSGSGDDSLGYGLGLILPDEPSRARVKDVMDILRELCERDAQRARKAQQAKR